MYSILNRIKNPDDLKGLSISELETLSAEIRDFLVHSVSKTGGHLASNLGVVELTVAMHTVFHAPKDKIVFDVGHQSYVHKILTGRMDGFATLRQLGGMSGFPKTNESEYDCFNTGHSSTSLSAALGLARGRDLRGEDYNVVALFGDGALTGGMMYEALNDAGRSKTNLIAILNDNAMSISRNVGAISKYLRILRSKPAYFKSKRIVERFLNRIPVVGKKLSSWIKKLKLGIKHWFLPVTIFEDLGFEYLGPVNGHNIKSLLAVLEQAKKLGGPVFIHVHTKKGKGYALAEQNPQKFHGISKFNVDSGELKASAKDYSSVFGDTLCAIAKENPSVAAITAAMPVGTGLSKFSKQFPRRFFDVGIAEQHAMTLAAGLSASGTVPVIALYSSFLQRAYDQVLHDICLQNLHVVICIDRAGIVGADGETHQGIYDISFLSHMPNLSILSPCNFKELSDMLCYAVNEHDGPIAIRYPRGTTQAGDCDIPFSYGKSALLEKGTDLTILAAGRMVKTAQDVAHALHAHGITSDVLSLRTVKPLDESAVLASAHKTGHVITLEDHIAIGGIGSLVSSLFTRRNTKALLHSFAFPDEPVTHGTISELDRLYGLDAVSITDYVLSNYFSSRRTCDAG